MQPESSPRSPPLRFGWADAVAGVSVALVLIPQAVAYAALAGMPPIHGLYAAIAAPLAAAFFASSPYLQTGPVAITSVMVFGALSTVALPFSPEYVALAALLAFVVGVVRVVVGLSRTGYIAYLMSQPVLSGFVLGAAILIVASQLPGVLGVAAPSAGVIRSSVWAVTHPADWNWVAMAFAAGTLALVLGGSRIHALFPGVLVAAIGSLALSQLIDYAGATVGTLPSRRLPLPSLSLPWTSVSALIVPGLVIALVGFAEPSAIARTMAARARQRWDADREFISQGVANLATGLTAGFPVGGSFTRSALSRAAGARTRWSGGVAGLTVLAFLPFASVLAPLPQAVLAATVIGGVIRLMSVRPLLRLIRSSRAQAGVALSTFGLTLLLAPRIDLAVLLGVGFGVAVHLWRERRLDVSSTFENGTLRIEPVGVLYFGSAPLLDDALLAEVADHPDVRRVVLDLRRVGRIDFTGALVLEQVAREAEDAGLEVIMIPGRPPQGARILKRMLGDDADRWLEVPQ